MSEPDLAVTLNPAVLAWLAGGSLLYVRALRICRSRGLRIGGWQQAAWWTGMSLMAVALVSPVDALGEELLGAHMAQHLLIADLGAPLILAGLRAPLLLFFLPRPALVALARRRRLRAAFRWLRKPLVAVPVYVGVLYLWHLDFMFVGALQNDLVHAIQHQSFVAISLLVWWSALEPQRRRVPGEMWKIAHITSARLAGMFLGMAFIAIRVPVYTDAYGEQRPFGFTAVADQQTAGGLMLSLDFFVVIFALSFFFWRAATDHDRAMATTSTVRG